MEPTTDNLLVSEESFSETDEEDSEFRLNAGDMAVEDIVVAEIVEVDAGAGGPEIVCEFEYYEKALKDFLLSQMSGYEHFLYGRTTSYTESFHNVCGKYYRKGISCCFAQYKMRKQMAGMDWNEQRFNKLNPTIVKGPLQRWQYDVIGKFKAAISS